MDDQELQRTEQGSVSIHVAVPNTATILDALALVPEVYFAVLGFSSQMNKTDSQPQAPLPEDEQR